VHVTGIAGKASLALVWQEYGYSDGLRLQTCPIMEAGQGSALAVLVPLPCKLFYHDLPTEEGEYWVRKLTKQASRC